MKSSYSEIVNCKRNDDKSMIYKPYYVDENGKDTVADLTSYDSIYFKAIDVSETVKINVLCAVSTTELTFTIPASGVATIGDLTGYFVAISGAKEYTINDENIKLRVMENPNKPETP